METKYIILIVIAVLVIFFVILYNRLVALRQSRKQSFSDIDVQLKLRYDLIPNLVETVKGYASHEKEVFENVTKMRAQAGSAGSLNEKMAAEAGLTAALGKMMLVAEAYPDLKANENFMNLQGELSDIENKVAAARRFFNNATTELNTAVQQFPAVIIARMFNFKEEEFFDVPDEERERNQEPVKVSFN